MHMSTRRKRSLQLGALALTLAFAGAATSAQGQQTGGDAVVDPAAARQQSQEIAKGDPARWYRDEDQQKTLRKELGAALQEAQNACRQKPANERKACLQEAHATWQRETSQLQTQVQNAPQGQVHTTIQ